MTYRQMVLNGYTCDEAHKAHPDTPRINVRRAMVRARQSLRKQGITIPPPQTVVRIEAEQLLPDAAFEQACQQLRSGWGARIPGAAVGTTSRIGLTGMPERRVR